MSAPPDAGDPDRLFAVARGRGRTGGDPPGRRPPPGPGGPPPRPPGRAAEPDVLDVVALIVAEDDPGGGLSAEEVAVLRMCRGRPVALVELAARLEMPVHVARILLRDMRDTGRVTVRHPSTAVAPSRAADLETLKQVLVGLEHL
ncbi:DUF742 domain-containing protein [Actinomadura sp. WAC 06369]|uniref:DUF742 domain-containing protein n=1 Tax=Actinomadura sp. WAC 06369 TaxID=2203193 RepID=UPI000F77F205|nr:DUF742 domain-containing protein [Actinomadura sp. WAC 06369]RSN66597.1 DUF742 domain-containing protein [Actinomadura sp. WAC 06369]